MISKELAQIDPINLTPLQEAELNERIEKVTKETEERIEKFVQEQERHMTISLTSALASIDEVAIFIDGNKASKKDFDNLKPEKIQNINLHRNKEYTSAFGKDVEAVVFVKTEVTVIP